MTLSFVHSLMTTEYDPSKREFLKNMGILLWSAVVVWTWIDLIYNALNDDACETLFDEKHYLDITWKVDAPYMDHDILLEEMPTVYDNILYAKEITGKKNIEDTVIHTTCTRMQSLEDTIDAYASKYTIPANKLLGLIFLESEGKSNVGNKKTNYQYNCYGYTQLSVQVGKKYWAIQKDSKGKWVDKRDNLETALDATCKFLIDIHNRWVKKWHKDTNRSLTFASYHMWETHMRKILKIAQDNTDMKANTMQDLIGLNNKKVGNEFMELQDESYKYYPKLLAAWRIYRLFISDRWQFNHNVKEFLDSPIKRKPSLAEEYIWHWNKNYYEKNIDLHQGMTDDKLFGIKNKNKNLEIDWAIGEHMFLDEEEKQLPGEEQSRLKIERRECMNMTSKACRWLVKFISHYFPYDFKITSLTRSQEYNDRIYNTKGKWTSHSTGMAMDIWFPHTWEKKKYLKRILYGLEIQGKIAFLQEKNHFHVTINPKYRSYFEEIVEK